jgi:hypothetical protein
VDRSVGALGVCWSVSDLFSFVSLFSFFFQINARVYYDEILFLWLMTENSSTHSELTTCVFFLDLRNQENMEIFFLSY